MSATHYTQPGGAFIAPESLPADDAAWPQPPASAWAMPMQSPAWLRARAGLLAALGQRPSFIAIESAQGLDALAPLVRAGAWLREPPSMFEPSDWLWRTPQALEQLAQAVALQGLPLCLDRVPADSPTLPALRRAFAGRALLLEQPAMATPFIALDGPRWLQPPGDFSARRLADFRRYERRAAALGPVAYELHAPQPGAELQALMAQALAVESRSWKQRSRTALSSDALQGGFFAEFARHAAAAGLLRIALLRLGGQPVAMQIAAQWRGRFWLLKISHDEAFDACSPGQLLMRHTLLQAARQRLQSYEFMGVMDDWTRLWTRQTRAYVQLRVLPHTLAGGRALARMAAGRAYRGLRRWLPGR